MATRQGGDQPTRRLTVAELLAQHGKADAASSGGRRHRRRAAEEDVDAELTTTAPQEIIDRIHAERPQEDWAQPGSNGHAMAAGSLDPLDADTRAVRPSGTPPEPPRPVEPERAPKRAKRQPPKAGKPQPPTAGGLPPVQPEPPRAKPEPPRAGRTGSGYAPAVQPPPPGRRRPWEEPTPPADSIVDRLNGGTRQGLTPPPAAKPPQTPPPPSKQQLSKQQPSKQQLKPVQPKLQPPPPPPPRRPMRQPEPMTDEFPMVEDDVEYLDDYADEDYAEGDYAVDDLAVEPEPELLSGRRRAEPEVAGDGEFDEEYEEFDDEAELAAAEADDRTVGQQWLAVGAQLALGVVGGAAVWLLFNWLWNALPAVALAAALIVTAGLVWIVRNIRKAEDMQSTVLAVLVGLVVTVSPAALLLLSSR